jgi:DNA-binding MarR family transcriptional regulator
VTLQLDSPAAHAPDAAEPAFGALVRTFGLLRRVMEPYFADFGISGAQWGVLRTLYRATVEGAGPQLRLTDLGDRLIVRPPSITGVVDRLQKMGLVARTVSPTDHRVKLVRLTRRGRTLVEQVLQHHPQQVAIVLGGLGAAEQHQLQRLLEQMEPHLTALADSAERGERVVVVPASIGDDGQTVERQNAKTPS